MRSRHRGDDAVLVTSAPRSPADEIRARQRRYLWTMGFRTLAFVLSIVFFVNGLPAVGGVTLVAAFFLPWIAVVVANAGPVRGGPEQPSFYDRTGRRPLGPGPPPDDR